jgi:hypothetical protein
MKSKLNNDKNYDENKQNSNEEKIKFYTHKKDY